MIALNSFCALFMLMVVCEGTLQIQYGSTSGMTTVSDNGAGGESFCFCFVFFCFLRSFADSSVTVGSLEISQSAGTPDPQFRSLSISAQTKVFFFSFFHHSFFIFLQPLSGTSAFPNLNLNFDANLVLTGAIPSDYTVIVTETDYAATNPNNWDVDFQGNTENTVTRLRVYIDAGNAAFAQTSLFYDSASVSGSVNADQNPALPPVTGLFSVTALWTFNLVPGANNDITLDADVSIRNILAISGTE